MPMKKQLFLLTIMLLFGSAAIAQSGRVLGYWLTEDEDSQVEVFQKADNQYYGRIVWLDEPLEEDGTPKVDDKNPDKAMHDTPIMGLEILKGFSYDASKNEWSGGTIYDPKNGRTYTAFMRLDGNNKLAIRGYVMGMRFLGRTTEWTREGGKRE